MKKILGLTLGLLFAAFTYAQSPVTFTDAGDDYQKTETTVFHFTFDESITHEKINENATYYTEYFSVTATDSENGHTVEIALEQDDEMSRRVVMRLFVSLEVDAIIVQGEEIPLREFTKQYIEL
ncbi:MAG: hypothetical protein WDZ35_04990 [Crocinitomicaceae bacterium]